MAYWRLRRLVERYKAAVGKPAKEVPPEIEELYRRIEEQKRKIRELEEKKASADIISIELTRLGDLEAQFRQLLKQHGLAES